MSTTWLPRSCGGLRNSRLCEVKTASDPEARFNAKTQLVRNLYSAGYTADQHRELFRLIDWMMHLRSDLDRRFKTELIAYEKELHMQYVTSVERLAKEEGREEGREEASLALVLRLLTRPCGALPVDVEQSVRRLSLPQIEALSDSLFDFKSLADLKNWLAASCH